MTEVVALKQELLECARYGETEDLLAILEDKTIPVDHADEGGNTALHKVKLNPPCPRSQWEIQCHNRRLANNFFFFVLQAAANGHLGCCEALIKAGATWSINSSGNTPLHWACANGKLEVAALLLKAFSGADVLLKNGFGQSALSESFRSGNTDVRRVAAEAAAPPLSNRVLSLLVRLCRRFPSFSERRGVPRSLWHSCWSIPRRPRSSSWTRTRAARGPASGGGVTSRA